MRKRHKTRKHWLRELHLAKRTTDNLVNEAVVTGTAASLLVPPGAFDVTAGGGPDADADPISEFYTEHPYPPPVQNLDRAYDEWRDGNRRRAEYHLYWPDRPFREGIDILVAGCGTWQAAKYAFCHPEARVVGIDVSTTSLEHTERLKKKYNLTNLETRQMPIENIGKMGRGFDLIVCTGVLHHLADPDTALAALRSVLRPGGAIYLMVYAPYGRAGIYMLQDYCRRLGVGTSAIEINDLATMVEALPPEHPLVALLRGSRDALDADALADALLNPRDRSYSVPQLLGLIRQSGLTFGRWYWQAPYLSRCGSMAATPHAKRIAGLPASEQYAAMELLRGTMTCHSVIAYQGETSGGIVITPFDDHWQNSVPLRLPTTMCVEERLPAGAAGVLLNRSHQFHDLILMIDAHEKKIFDVIDGRRSINEILAVAGVDKVTTRERSFFERLWQYDQVVFDMSER